jgi:hypothetical protein
MENRQFIDSVIREIIEPGTQRLMASRYFSDLRAGKLTTRRIQGFALQHYIHNMGILKAFALGATQHDALFKEAGLKLVRVIETDSYFHIMEALSDDHP